MIPNRRSFPEVESGWSVILNPVRGELAKSEIARHIIRTFSISEEEANYLIDNTPVVLFEDLVYEQAHKVKGYLATGGMDITVTNNPLQRRKCFKTIWPNDTRWSLPKEFASPFDLPAIENKGEVLSSEEAVRRMREERDRDGDHRRFPAEAREEGVFRKKYEGLLREHSMLLEEKLIQEKKIEALEQEIKFLRDKENTLAGELGLGKSEKENLQHELEALRVKHELLVKQADSGEELRKKAEALQGNEKALRERLTSLGGEYEEAERVWAEKVKEQEQALGAALSEVESFKRRAEELGAQLKTETENHRAILVQESLGLQERMLKDLVRRQRDLEREITEKERDLKAVLSEQEKIEKEIVRAKQFKP